MIDLIINKYANYKKDGILLYNRILNSFSETTKRILKGSFWSLLGSVLSKFLVLLSTILVSRLLGKETYGQLGIIRTTIQLFLAFSAFGIGTTASKYIAEYRNTNKYETSKIYLISNIFALTMATIISLIVILLAPIIATKSFQSPELTDEIRIAGFILFFSTLNGAQTGTLAGFEDFKSIAKASVVSGVAEIILVVTGSILGGLKGTLLGFGFAYFIAWMYYSYCISKHFHWITNNLKCILKSLKLQDFAIIYKFSLPIAISSILSIPAIWWTKTYLVRNCGFGAMASYTVAEQWRTQLLFIPSAISQVMLPILSSMNYTGNQKDKVNAIKINLIINISISLILCLVILLVGKYIVKAYGSDYNNTMPLYILAITGVIISITNVLGSVIISHNKAWQVLYINLIWGVSLVFLSIYFISLGYSENGLALANLCSYLIFLIILIYKSQQLFKTDLQK